MTTLAIHTNPPNQMIRVEGNNVVVDVLRSDGTIICTIYMRPHVVCRVIGELRVAMLQVGGTYESQ